VNEADLPEGTTYVPSILKPHEIADAARELFNRTGEQPRIEDTLELASFRRNARIRNALTAHEVLQ